MSISLLLSVIRSNHASDKAISFFLFVLLSTLYLCYLDIKFIAFSVLLWYGRRVSAIFIILSQYTAARKLAYFNKKVYKQIVKKRLTSKKYEMLKFMFKAALLKFPIKIFIIIPLYFKSYENFEKCMEYYQTLVKDIMKYVFTNFYDNVYNMTMFIRQYFMYDHKVEYTLNNEYYLNKTSLSDKFNEFWVNQENQNMFDDTLYVDSKTIDLIRSNLQQLPWNTDSDPNDRLSIDYGLNNVATNEFMKDFCLAKKSANNFIQNFNQISCTVPKYMNKLWPDFIKENILDLCTVDLFYTIRVASVEKLLSKIDNMISKFLTINNPTSLIDDSILKYSFGVISQNTKVLDLIYQNKYEVYKNTYNTSYNNNITRIFYKYSDLISPYSNISLNDVSNSLFDLYYSLCDNSYSQDFLM